MAGRGHGGDAPAPLGCGAVAASTAAAVCVRVGRREAWIPRSALHPTSEITGNEAPGTRGRVVVAAWFARARGWT